MTPSAPLNVDERGVASRKSIAEVTPPHCSHYGVCYYVRDRKANRISKDFLCLNDDPYLLDQPQHLLPPCRMDTRRSRPAPASPALAELPDEVLDRLCWADIVLLVQGIKEKEDIGFCKGESCNYCGKFNEAAIQREQQERKG